MYAIYGNIYHQYTPNVRIYTIHGSYGLWWGLSRDHTPLTAYHPRWIIAYDHSVVAPRASLPLLLRCIFPSPIFGELGNANSKHSLDKILAVAQRSMYFPIHPETVLFFFSGDFLIFHWIAPRLFPSNMGVPGSCHICPSTKCQDFAKFHEFLTYSPIQSSGKSDFYDFFFFPTIFLVFSPHQPPVAGVSVVTTCGTLTTAARLPWHCPRPSTSASDDSERI